MIPLARFSANYLELLNPEIITGLVVLHSEKYDP